SPGDGISPLPSLVACRCDRPYRRSQRFWARNLLFPPFYFALDGGCGVLVVAAGGLRAPCKVDQLVAARLHGVHYIQRDRYLRNRPDPLGRAGDVCSTDGGLLGGADRHTSYITMTLVGSISWPFQI